MTTLDRLAIPMGEAEACTDRGGQECALVEVERFDFLGDGIIRARCRYCGQIYTSMNLTAWAR